MIRFWGLQSRRPACPGSSPPPAYSADIRERRAHPRPEIRHAEAQRCHPIRLRYPSGGAHPSWPLPLSPGPQSPCYAGNGWGPQGVRGKRVKPGPGSGLNSSPCHLPPSQDPSHGHLLPALWAELTQGPGNGRTFPGPGVLVFLGAAQAWLSVLRTWVSGGHASALGSRGPVHVAGMHPLLHLHSPGHTRWRVWTQRLAEALPTPEASGGPGLRGGLGWELELDACGMASGAPLGSWAESGEESIPADLGRVCAVTWSSLCPVP